MFFGFPDSAVLFWFSAILFIVAAGYLFKRIQKENLTLLIPISVYLGAIGIFFTLMGINEIFPSNIVVLAGAFSVMFGASYIARFPLQLIIPKHEKTITIALIVISVIIAGYFFTQGDTDLQLRVANIFAFFVAGIFTIGYIFYYALKVRNHSARMKGLGTASSLGLCCVVAHGLAGLQIFPIIGISVFGLFTLKTPLLFAMLSPIVFIAILYLGHFMKNQIEGEVVKA